MSSHHDRRRFLQHTATGMATLGGGTLMSSATTAAENNARLANACPCPYGPPSNALVTGVDPSEMVLFAFDSHWLPFRRSLKLTLAQPELCEQNPVLRRRPQGEADSFFASFYGTVFRLDNKFRMWYGAVDSFEEFHPGRTNMRLAYAESDDGIYCTKPKLGLREYHGSKDNNLCGLDRECYTTSAYSPSTRGQQSPESQVLQTSLFQHCSRRDGLKIS